MPFLGWRCPYKQGGSPLGGMTTAEWGETCSYVNRPRLKTNPVFSVVFTGVLVNRFVSAFGEKQLSPYFSPIFVTPRK